MFTIVISNGNSFADDRLARSLPWPFRIHVPGFEGGWPAR